jgi:RHS repeat-associated protein
MKLIFVHKHGFFPSDEMQWKYSLPAKRTSGNDPPASGGMTYNADNQLKTWNSQTIVHDADGNMTTGPAPTGDTLTTYGYDSRNRLTDTPGNTFSYDADGQRVGMTSGADTTSFVTDVSSALSKVLVRTKNGVSTRYVWGLGLLYEVSSTGNTVSYHHDATGSTNALTDGTGKVIERIGYTPWGQINHRINLSGTPHDTPFLFTGFFGNQTDAGGLLYMRNRYYHPRIGRFLNADPAQEGMNWYAYAGGNPIGMVDPMGLGITSALNGIQTTLSFLGMAPVFGAVFDVVNAGISIGRGNYVDAGFNLASAIPGIGDFAAGAKLIGGGAAAYGSYRGGTAISHSYSAASHSYAVARTPLISTVADLRAAGLKDAHHVIQDAAVRDLPGYSSRAAPGIQLPGPSTAVGSPHYIATQVQRQAGGGTYAAERRIGYKAIRQAGVSQPDARQIISETDNWFLGIGVTPSTPTRIPGNR